MGLHYCRFPRWHRALILGSTLLALHGAMALLPWHPPVLIGILLGTWLVKHLVQWRCQGRAASDGRTAAALLLLVGSAAYLTHEDHDEPKGHDMRRILMILTLLALTSCADAAYLHSRAMFGLDCRTEKLQNGQCVSTR